ncbi:MAG: PQQ-binding-like beta-propeller repeat protein [Planctomycetes bacterium]|nr:PQQ-binding-like beta-propeller repeat protein [Planctomycetota bacterium]
MTTRTNLKRRLQWRFHRNSQMAVTCFAVLMVLLVICQVGCERKISTVKNRLAEEILADSGIQGGFIVHIRCGDGRLTAALCANESYLVHGLDANSKNIRLARRYIKSVNLYGRVSVEQFRGNRLPYADNLVNLIVCERPAEFPKDEIMRVLAPNGVALVKKGRKWEKMTKPRPEEIDEWTHYMHDAGGNPVAHDSVIGPPRHLQWVGSPRWARHHDHMASVSAVVSSGGRIFYIIDEGPKASIQLPPKWALVARDAFNGVVLWKRPITSWNTHLWPLKSGPAQLPRRLVAIGDRVYVTLGLDAPLTVLDAATGKTISTHKDTKTTEEIIVSDDVLFLLVTDSPVKWKEFRPESTYIWDPRDRANNDWAWDEKSRKIMAVKADTGEVLWQKEQRVTPLTLAADSQCLYFHDGESVVCLDRKTGEENWNSEPVDRRSPILTGYAPTLMVYQDVVLFSGGKRAITAFSAQTGKKLWMAKQARSGHNSPEDLFVIDGLVWSGATASGRDSGIFTGVDLHTGWIKKEFPPDVDTYWFHQRCYRSKATDKYILPSRTGIEFVDLSSEHWTTNHWVRGGCIYGITPCNGLIYAPPHPCACYIEAKLNGFNALAPASATRALPEKISDKGRLKTGPAYRRINGQSKSELQDDWPTYRHDPTRSGFTTTNVPSELKHSWQRDLGGRLSSVVVADGMLFVASIDTHTVYALDAGSGEILWNYTTAGRVDSPPTIYQGRVLFGSADGWVYCLRASDGVVAWRFRAAPIDLRLTAFEQLESVWPVHGNVLIKDDILYCIAGRSMFLDGGMRLLRLDPKTGKKLSETILDDRDPESGKDLQVHVKGLNMPVALPDILSSDGQYVYMRSQRFDLEGNREQIAKKDASEQTGEGAHLFCTIGFLDDSWFHRSYWMYGKSVSSGWGGWFRSGRFVPSGRLLVYDDSSVYGFGRKPEYLSQSSVLEYQLYAAEKQIESESIKRVMAAEKSMNATSKKRNSHAADRGVRKKFPLSDRSATNFRWLQEDPPIHIRAMVLANETLFIAGPKDVVDEEEAFYNPRDNEIQAKLTEQSAVLEGSKGGLLFVVSASDGQKIAEYELESLPVWDGMAAANNRLYFATKNGKIMCFTGRELALREPK